MADSNSSIETKLIHAGEPEPRIGDAIVPPIFQSSTFEYQGAGSYDDIRYARMSNTPTHDILHAKLAALENAEAALATSSGMAAITTALLSVLRQGDHLLVQDCLYGGTHSFVFDDLPGWGITVDTFNGTDPDSWGALVRPETKAIYAETITNPLIQVGELEAIAAFAKDRGLVSMIDNTFASPVNFRPPEWGFDLSLHSATKYLNGHTDLAAGAVIGSAKLVKDVHHMANHLGGSLDAHACFLLHRGVKTLAVRMRQQNHNAARIAEFLEAHPIVASVNYPGLESNRDHQRAGRLMDGFGGMLSFEVSGGVEAAQRVVRKVRLPIEAPSLGGVESLVTRPSTTSHAGMPPEARAAAGVTDSLIRMSVGIEAADDLIADLDQALGD
ncbi:MAG TPA: aminotransferase class I/II-fold pyridoxal phosphate-dependent enzyme [Acidobacteriota bacterium]|nr:aminotransferase class I/II-fold pyridoxal phosphate-dependent enzyme [Acidobacteriota bacterium]